MRYLGFLCFLLSVSDLPAQKVNICIYHDLKLISVIFTINQGSYNLESDEGKSIQLQKNDIVYFNLNKDRISFRLNSGRNELSRNIQLVHVDELSSMKIKPVFPSADIRRYQGDFRIMAANGKLSVINIAALDDYIAGVVESESGQIASPEYYKTQAIICRTYALSHSDRHANENFQLCDGVHCQVYLGMSYFRPEIVEATKATTGLVIVDQNNNLITAAFHSNCGGSTVNSENVWSISEPYLKAVPDTYCLKSPHSVWEKNIPVKKWIKYLADNGFKQTGQIKPDMLVFSQDKRKTYYSIGKDSLVLKKIRNDWDLRLTYFSIAVNDTILLLKGRGFGHGIGLCQEGAMKMATMGKSYSEIITYYYTGVKVVPLSLINKK